MTALLLLAAMLGFQEPAKQEPARIRVTTRMVEAGVVVQDRNGRPVTGLRAEDFELLDGGRAQQIRAFQTVAAGPPQSGQPRIATAILLDYLNTRFGDESFGRTELLNFLRALAPNHPVALISLDLGFQVIHDFSTDAASVARALEQHRPYRPVYAGSFNPFVFHDPPLVRAAGKGQQGAMLATAAAGAKLDAMVAAAKYAIRVKETASATRALAEYLSRVPGRKNLVWVSSSFPAVLAASLRQDDVAVYPVDVRTPIDGPCEAARILAARTGGVAFDHGNSVRRGITQAFESAASVYLLGYYPSHQEWKGQYRPIQVRVKRDGVEVRHRPGYVAVLEDTAAEQDEEKLLWEVADAGEEAQAIPVRAQFGRKNGIGGVTVAIDGKALHIGLNPQPGKPDLQLLLVPQRADGTSFEADYCKVIFDGGRSQRARQLKEVIQTTRPLTPVPGMERVRVVVRDPHTGALGSTTVLLAPPQS